MLRLLKKLRKENDMFWLGLIVGFIVGGGCGAGGMYLWKVRGKVLVQAQEVVAEVAGKATDVVGKVADKVK